MTRRAIRIAAAAGGLGLLAGLRAAPLLTPPAILLVSAAWLVLLAGLVSLGVRLAIARLGRPAGIGLSAALVALGIGVTGIDWSGRAGTYLPCRRNWGWLPSYLLRSSPTRSLTFDLGGSRVRLCYGQPAARGRRMIGGAAVPFGRLWRTGANEPTTLRSSTPLAVAGIVVTGGKASLYTVPGPETWEVVVNQSTAQWGLESEYTPQIQARELGRSVVPSLTVPEFAERLEFRVEPQAGDTVALVLHWETTLVRIPLVPAP